MKKIFGYFIFLLSSFLIFSCAYQGTSKKDFYNASQINNEKISAYVTISKNDSYIRNINASGALGTNFEFNVKGGLLDAVEGMASNIF